MTSAAVRARACAVGAAIAVSMQITGCAHTVEGTAMRGHGAGLADVAPLDEAELDDVLLDIDELNALVGSTRMTIVGELDEMTDHSDEVSDPDCLGAIYGAEASVYEGTDWTEVRDQVAREPGPDNDHWVEQVAVLYPAADNAKRFFDESMAIWQDCANDAIVVGEGEYLWRLDGVKVGDTQITQMTTQEGADGWACQHAVSLVANVTVEAWACGYRITDEAAHIADAMVENAAN